MNSLKIKGIIFSVKYCDNFSNYIHIELESRTETLEIYDITNKFKETYKFKKFKDNIYFTICPINYNNEGKLQFGIRDYKNIDSTIEYKNDKIYKCRQKGKYETFIEKNENNIFNIFNEPEFNDNTTLLLYLEKLNEFDYYSCEYKYIKKATYSIPYTDLIDKIMEIGIDHKLTKKLIKILEEKEVNIYQISNYLENNKNTKFNNILKFSEISSYIIYELNEISKFDEINKDEENENYIDKRKCIICCDKNIPNGINQTSLDNKNLFQNIKEKFKKNKDDIYFNEYKSEIEKKIENLDDKGEFSICSLTDETLKKIKYLEYGIKAKISMIIQGFTSAGKSFLSKLACKINNKKYEIAVLSEQTTVEDLLGRDSVDKNNMISFTKGILLDAYTEGKIVILDECDLANSEVLSCILATITNDELNIKNRIYDKNDNYMLILTMNGESKGFNESQRNVLSSQLLSKFNITKFNEIDKNESEIIFKELIKKMGVNNINAQNFIELHEKMNNKEQKTIDPIITLRNLKNCILLIKNGISQRISAEISYTRRFPEQERKEFENMLNNFGEIEFDEESKKEIEKNKKHIK